MKALTVRNELIQSISITFLFILGGCSSGTFLLNQPLAGLEAERGSYDLILYGGQNPQEFNSIAILDRTDDAYTMLPHGATFNYRIINNLSSAEAFELGEQFIRKIYSYRASEKRVIYAPNHTVVGYELRPLFMPTHTGRLGDILDTSYLLQADNQIIVHVGFKGGYQSPLDSSGIPLLWGR